MNNRYVIYTHNLCIHRVNGEILNNINIYGNEGDIICIFGSTGSGKTTLLKTLTGIIPTLYKGIKIHGEITIYGYSPEEALAKGITTYVPQDIYSFFVGSIVKEELAALGLNNFDIAENLGIRLDKNVYELSDGQLYKLILFEAMYSGSKVIAIDEPSSHIDWWSIKNILQYIKEFVLNTSSVVLVADHRINLIREICNKTVYLSHISETCNLPRIFNRTRNRVILLLDRVSLYYNHILIFRDISIEIKQGEVIAIIGKNGVGKTSLLKTIAGFIKPSTGRIFLEKNIRIFMIPQNPVYWFPSDSVKNVIKLFIDKFRSNESVNRILEMFGLDLYSDTNTYVLSIGTARVLSIALSYIAKADVVLIDEPTLGLDCRSKYMVIEALNKLAKEGYSIIIATHDIDFSQLFDNIYMLEEGVLKRLK